MARKYRPANEYEKEFLRIVDEFCCSRQKWEVWSDLMSAMACAISNSTENDDGRREKREQEYLSCIRRLGDAELTARAFATIVEALEDNPDQDFLGDMYMKLELGSHWHGQLFTPYSLSKMMAVIQLPDPSDEIRKRGWISLCDPCIGGGAMMIAAAGVLREKGICYHEHAVFIGQDIDRIAAQMAYIQLSLLGCPGYIVVANTLANPLTGPVLEPEEKEGQEFWYMPFFFNNTWVSRRLAWRMDRFLRTHPAGSRKKEPDPEEGRKKRYFYFFDFRGGSELYGTERFAESERF